MPTKRPVLTGGSKKRPKTVKLDDGDRLVLDAICTALSKDASEVMRLALHAYAGALKAVGVLKE